MEIRRIIAIYFSPTGGTKKVVQLFAHTINDSLQTDLQWIDYTRPEVRAQPLLFQASDLVLLGLPVYAGRIPNKISPDLKAGVHGNTSPVVPICVYGNRSDGDALRELILLTEQNGFLPVAAASAVSRHAFSDQLAAGRPDERDTEQLRAFAGRIARALQSARQPARLDINRSDAILPYYTPLKADGTPAQFLKAKPLTDPSRCNRCGICASVCPMGSICPDDVTQVPGICIKCQACVRHCASHAKYFDDPDFLSHVQMLEQTCRGRADNRLIEPQHS